eukprot:6458807-Amphidinium_carterae.1
MGLEPYDIIDRDIEKQGWKSEADVHGQLLTTPLPPNYWSGIEDSDLDDVQPIIPLAIFLDGMMYNKSQSVFVIVLVNLLSKSRFLLTCCRKAVGCKCGCSGWCTLATMLQWVTWVFTQFEAGVYPKQNHNAEDFADSLRIERGGKRMKWRGKLLQVRVDWAEWSHSLGVPSWKSNSHPCPFCWSSQKDFKKKQG